MTDERFEQMQKMLTDLIGVVGATNSKVSNLAETVETLSGTVEKLSERVETLSGTVEKLSERVETLSDTVEKLSEQTNTRFDSFDKRLSSIEQVMFRLDRLEKRQNMTTVRVEELEADVALIQDQLNS